MTAFDNVISKSVKARVNRRGTSEDQISCLQIKAMEKKIKRKIPKGKFRRRWQDTVIKDLRKMS